MKEYDIYVPLYYNDGSPIEPIVFRNLHRRLLEQFQGLTFFPQPNEGFWKMGDVVYRDEIVSTECYAPSLEPRGGSCSD